MQNLLTTIIALIFCCVFSTSDEKNKVDTHAQDINVQAEIDPVDSRCSETKS